MAVHLIQHGHSVTSHALTLGLYNDVHQHQTCACVQDLPLDHPDVQTLLSMEPQEEPPPFPGARQILRWEQRLVCNYAVCLIVYLDPQSFRV